MTIPQLSIIVPTRERAEVLRETLATLVALSLQDVEFVICDNCSSDETAQVVSAYSDSRIRYVRSPERLSMPDNFALGLDHARGRYIVTLGDDDLVVEENLRLALAQAEKADADLVYWFRGCFYWGTYPTPQAGLFLIPRGRGHYRVDGGALLQASYLGHVSYQYLPSIYNSVISRSFLQRYGHYLRGEYFLPGVVSVDVFTALVFSSLSPKIFYQQSSATVSGISHRSNGMSHFAGGAEGQAFRQELGMAREEYIMPTMLRGSIRPVLPHGVLDLTILADYELVAYELLRHSQRSPPDFELLARIQLRRLIALGHLQVDLDSAVCRRLLAGTESMPVELEDLGKYFFDYWHIPRPDNYVSRFESSQATVRHLDEHLRCSGFNEFAAA
jgi:hypothetical protein